MENTNILQAMFEVARTDLKSYTTDFIIHDVGFLNNNSKKGNIFAWGVREMGTHIALLNSKDQSGKNGLSSLKMINDSFESIDWYVLKISNDFNLNDGFYPKGLFKKVDFDYICNLIKTGFYENV